MLNGHKYGVINGFQLKLDDFSFSHSLFSLSHVKKSLNNMIEDKISNFLNAPYDSINFGNPHDTKLNQDIKIFWGDEHIGVLLKGNNIHSPKAQAINSEFLNNEKKLLVSAKLQDWINKKINEELKPIKEKLDDSISSNIRSIIFNTFNQLGCMLIGENFNFIKKINDDEKTYISKLGLRIGAKFFFTPSFLKKSAMELCAILWKVYYEFSKDSFFPLPKDGRVSFKPLTQMPNTYWNAIGYLYLNNFALRIDVFERIFFLARQKIKAGPFLESADMMNPVGCNSGQLRDILTFCGFACAELGNEKKLFYLSPKRKAPIKSFKNKAKINIDLNKKKINKKMNKNKIKSDPNSPFAVLEKLL